MTIATALVGALIAWSLFGSKDAKSRAEHSGLEKGMILLGLVAFGALFAFLF
jgi:hypothetical protein